MIPVMKIGLSRQVGRNQLVPLSIQLVLCLLFLAAIASPALGAKPTRKSTTPGKPTPATSASKPDRDLSAAKVAFEDGLRAFNLGIWEDAIASFQNSYRLSGDSALLFNVAQAQRHGGHSKEAIITYKAYLRETPNTPHRELVTSKIRDLETDPNVVAPAAVDPGVSRDRMAGMIENPFNDKGSELPAITGPTELLPSQKETPVEVETKPLVSRPIPLVQPVPAATPAPAVIQGNTDVSQEKLVAPTGNRWWLWGGIGAAVVATVVTVVILSNLGPQRDASCPLGFDGCLPVGR